jgi:hypothetical protein
MKTRTVVGLVAAGLAVAVLFTLYATGPSHKVGRCYPGRWEPDPYAPNAHIVGGGCTHKRTNAFERIKGAVTGNP